MAGWGGCGGGCSDGGYGQAGMAAAYQKQMEMMQAMGGGGCAKGAGGAAQGGGCGGGGCGGCGCGGCGGGGCGGGAGGGYGGMNMAPNMNQLQMMMMMQQNMMMMQQQQGQQGKGQQPGGGGGGGYGGGKFSGGKGGGKDVSCDPEMKQEVDDFVLRWNLEGERFEGRIIEQLKKRGSTWREDLRALADVMGEARNPPGLLSVKLREMEEGTFQPRGSGGGGGGGGGGGFRGGNDGMCNDFKRGMCDRGDRCKFSHCEGGGGGGGGKGGGGSSSSSLEGWQREEIQALGDRYNLDDRLQGRLSNAMSSRRSTFKEDMNTLDDILSSARNPPGLLSVKIREMEDGTFAAKGGGKGKGGGDRFGKGKGGDDRGSKGGGMSDERKRQLFGSSLSPDRSKRDRKDSRDRGRRSPSGRRERSPSRKRIRSDSRNVKSRNLSRSRDRRGNSRSPSRKKKTKEKDKDKGKDKDRDRKEKERDRNRDRGRDSRDSREGRDLREGREGRECRDRDKSRDRDRSRSRGHESHTQPRQPVTRAPEPEAWKKEHRACSRSQSREGIRSSPSRSRGRSSPSPPRRPGGETIPPPPSLHEPFPVRMRPPVPEDDEVHYGISCSRCRANPIRGDRFKCSVCDAFDLCEGCYEHRAEIHPGGHRFFVQKVVAPVAAPPPPAPVAAAEAGGFGVGASLGLMGALQQQVGAFGCGACPGLMTPSQQQGVPSFAPPLGGANEMQQHEAAIQAMAARQAHEAMQMLYNSMGGTFMGAAAPSESPRFTSSKSPPRFPPSKSPPRFPPSKSPPRFTPSKSPPRFAPSKSPPRFAPSKSPPRLSPTRREVQAPSEPVAFPPPPPAAPEPPPERAAAPMGPQPTRKAVEEAKKAPEQAAPAAAPPAGPAWLLQGTPCSFCKVPGSGRLSAKEPHGVICRRTRERGRPAGGCGQGVCWACMESRSRRELGMVRTTKEEFESLDDDAWWMHEACMEGTDLIEYFGGQKALQRARQAADEAEALERAAETRAAAGGSKGSQPKQDATNPVAAAQDKVRSMSVKELKAYLEKHKTDISNCVEKSELLEKALQVAANAPPELPSGPAWMPVGSTCRLCTKEQKQERSGIICRRKRADGTVGGCQMAVCWRCMKKAPRDSFGKVRTTKEEFESLDDEAWWMHEACFEEGDYKDYFGEPEPEDDRRRREARISAGGEEWTSGGW